MCIGEAIWPTGVWGQIHEQILECAKMLFRCMLGRMDERKWKLKCLHFKTIFSSNFTISDHFGRSFHERSYKDFHLEVLQHRLKFVSIAIFKVKKGRRREWSLPVSLSLPVSGKVMKLLHPSIVLCLFFVPFSTPLN